MSQQAAQNCEEEIFQYCDLGYDENLYSSHEDCMQNKPCLGTYHTPLSQEEILRREEVAKKHLRNRVIKAGLLLWTPLVVGGFLIKNGYSKQGKISLGVGAFLMVASQTFPNFSGCRKNLFEIMSFDFDACKGTPEPADEL